MSTNLFDLDILDLFRSRECFQKYYSPKDLGLFLPEVRSILKAYNMYYKTYSGDLDLGKFVPFFFSQHKDYTPDDIVYYKQIFKKVGEVVLDDKQVTLQGLRERRAWEDLVRAKEDGFNVIQMRNTLDEYEQSSVIEEDKELVPLNDRDYCLQTHVRPDGYEWCLGGLRKALHPLIKGDAIIVFAPVNSGKSLFCLNQAVFTAKQCQGNKKVVIFVNEGKSESYALTLKCIALKAAPSRIAKANWDSVLRAYKEQLNGDADRILIYEWEGKGIEFVEEKLQKLDPALVILDQLDNAISEKQLGGRRPYRRLYEHVRHISQKFAPFLIVSQASNTQWAGRNGETHHKRWLDLTDLHDSKIDKQGAGDAMIGLGYDPETPLQRYISIPKIKERKENLNDCDTQFTCNLDYKTRRFLD